MKKKEVKICLPLYGGQAQVNLHADDTVSLIGPDGMVEEKVKEMCLVGLKWKIDQLESELGVLSHVYERMTLQWPELSYLAVFVTKRRTSKK